MAVLRFACGLCALSVLAAAAPAGAQSRVSYTQALALSRERAPNVAVARATQGVAEADSRTGGLYPNPTLSAGTSTQTARLSLGASLPLLILGQRGAALDAGRAEYAVAKLDTQVSLSEVRAATGHAFVGLWLAEHTALTRLDAATISRTLDSAVEGRVELGSAPQLEGLRAHAERLRADVDARAAADLVDAASAELAIWIGVGFDDPVRVSGDPEVPRDVPKLSELWSRVGENPSVQRAAAEARASEARASSERAQVRPLMTLDLGADFDDPTLPGLNNYRAQLGFEVPLLNQRGPLIEREERKAVAARSQFQAERIRLSSELIVAYRTFGALTQQAQTLAFGVLPAAAAAARATEESYALGRAPLVSVLDAERARIDAELTLIESQGARANAWIDVERALGVQ
jgi:cobalt-zinc-cadmium efflux system outer membrane protein